MSREYSLLATLEDHCLLYLVTHITEISPETLSLLPKHLRVALLKSVAPIHLCWLEQTTVGEGIDTEPIWRTFSDISFHRNTWAVAYPDDDCTGHTVRTSLRDLYMTYMFSLSQNYTNKEYVSKRAKVALFGLFKAHLSEGMHCLLQLYCASLKGPSVQAGNTEPEVGEYYLAELPHESWDHDSITETILKYNAMPDKVRIPVTSRLALNCNSEPTKILLHALSKANVRSISIFNTHTNKEHDEIACLIVEAVVKQEKSSLKNLDVQLTNAKALQSVTKNFTAPDGYSRLKGISVSLPAIDSKEKDTSVTNEIQLFSSMIQHQTFLECLTLEGDWLYTKRGINISSDIAPLFSRPHFKRLDLVSDTELPHDVLCPLITSFFQSKSCDTQELHLRGFRVPGLKATPPDIVPGSATTPSDDITPGSATTPSDDMLEDSLMGDWSKNIDSDYKTSQKFQHSIEERIKHQASMYSRSRRASKDEYSFGEHLIYMTTISIKNRELERVGICIEDDYQGVLNNRPAKYPKINGNPFDSERKVKDGSCANEEKDSSVVETPSCDDESMDATTENDSESEVIKNPTKPQKILVFQKVNMNKLFFQWLCNQSCVCLLGLEVEVDGQLDHIKSLSEFFASPEVVLVSHQMQMERLYCSFNVYDKEVVLSD